MTYVSKSLFSTVDLWSDDCNVALLNGPPEGYVVSIERPLYQGLVGPPQPGQSARRVEVSLLNRY